MSWLCNFAEWFFSIPDYKILLIGLDGCGKSNTKQTPFIYQTHFTYHWIKQYVSYFMEDGVSTTTMHFSQWTMWDVGGSADMRIIWPNYLASADAVIYMVDGSDYSRLMESKSVFFDVMVKLCDSRNGTVPVALLVNKIDLEYVQLSQKLSDMVKEWVQELNSNSSTSKLKTIQVYACSALNGQGIQSAVSDFESTLISLNAQR